MELTMEKTKGHMVVGFTVDHLDATNAREFRHAVASVLEENASIIFNMSSLQFVDSSGLGGFLSCLRKVNATDGKIRMYGLTENVRKFFVFAGMNRLVGLYDSKEEALSMAVRNAA